MKVTVTIEIDKELKEMFEKTRSVHNLTFGEVLEMEIRNVLIGLNDSALIEQELKRIELEILSKSQKLANLKKLREEIVNLRK
ncbi:MAG: hypothetical protein WC556_12635 [Candidatus Methanoperedens sp.]